MLRVLLADDHPMYRYGLAAVLDQAESVDVVGTVGDGEALLTAAAEHRPDVVITDLSMPDLDGVTATRRLLEVLPELPVLVLTMHEDDEHVFAALRAGALGYLVKGADGEEIVRAVHSVANGEAVYGGSVARRIIAFYSGRTAGSARDRAFPDLTPRELEVLEVLATGCRNHEIARRLGMSEKTVRNHVSQVLAKLQVPDRTAAALRAREAGLGRSPSGAEHPVDRETWTFGVACKRRQVQEPRQSSRRTMTVSDPWGMPISCTAEVAPTYGAALRTYHDRRSGDAELLQQVVAEDPGFAVGRATAALWAAFMDAPDEARSEAEAARQGRQEHAWEKSFVAAVAETVERGRWRAMPSWLAHHDAHPGDLMGAMVAAFLLEMSTEPDGAAEGERRVARTMAAVGEDQMLLGYLAMAAQDRGDLETSHRLASRSLELDPTGFAGGHPISHVYFESGDHGNGLAWLDAWLPTTDQEAMFGRHLVWHAALHHLALGDGDGALGRYPGCGGSTAGGRLIDGPSLLWRCQLPRPRPTGGRPGDAAGQRACPTRHGRRSLHVSRCARRPRTGDGRRCRRPAPLRPQRAELRGARRRGAPARPGRRPRGVRGGRPRQGGGCAAAFRAVPVERRRLPRPARGLRGHLDPRAGARGPTRRGSGPPAGPPGPPIVAAGHGTTGGDCLRQTR